MSVAVAQDPYQTEEVVITGFPGSSQVSFSPALLYSHFGAITYGVDQRASIGLLSRSLLFTTAVERWSGTNDTAGSPGTLGMHIMLMQGFSACHVEGISILNGGQGDFQARYPFHWHLAGAVPAGTYLRASSIEDSLFRGVTIHGTQYAVVEDVVAYNITGHCWFLEGQLPTASSRCDSSQVCSLDLTSPSLLCAQTVLSGEM